MKFNYFKIYLKKNFFSHVPLVIGLAIGAFFFGLSILVFNSSAIQIEQVNQEYGQNYMIKKKVDDIIPNTSELNAQDMPSIELLRKFGTSEYVKDMDIQASNKIELKNINLIGKPENAQAIITTFQENSHLQAPLGNSIKLEQGAYPTKSGDVLISEQLAQKNKLRLDSKLTIVNNDQEREVTVKGIFSIINKQNTNELLESVYNSDNTIYEYQVVEQSILASDSALNASYHLKKQQDGEVFENDLYKMGLSNEYYVDNNQILIANITANLENAKNTSLLICISSFFISCIILIAYNRRTLERNIKEFEILNLFRLRKKELILVTILEKSLVIAIAITVAFFQLSLNAQSFANLVTEINIKNEKSNFELPQSTLSDIQLIEGSLPTIEDVKINLSNKTIIELIGYVVVLILIVAIQNHFTISTRRMRLFGRNYDESEN
ncbi:MAG: hypothetical protein ACRCUP_06785 [Mycoplasmatales bacterium]